jgi:nucleotidyltransferase substrate binding protein (TIGR01987 family)
MSEPKINQSLASLGKALARLKEALGVVEPSDLIVDGTIQRFEFVIELFWKTLKRCLASEGVETSTPRETLQKAYQAHWFDNEVLWLQMLKDRNLTSHIYNEDMALKIFRNIETYYPALEQTYRMLAARFCPPNE